MAARSSSRRSRCRTRPPWERRTGLRRRLGRMAGGGEDREQPAGADMAAGAGRRSIGVGHGTALVEHGMTAGAAELVDGHGGPPPAAYARRAQQREPPWRSVRRAPRPSGSGEARSGPRRCPRARARTPRAGSRRRRPRPLHPKWSVCSGLSLGEVPAVSDFSAHLGLLSLCVVTRVTSPGRCARRDCGSREARRSARRSSARLGGLGELRVGHRRVVGGNSTIWTYSVGPVPGPREGPRSAVRFPAVCARHCCDERLRLRPVLWSRSR